MTTSGLLRLRPKMLRKASLVRRGSPTVLAGLLSTVASLLLPTTLSASPESVRVLLVVPPGVELAGIERARSAVPPSQTALLVAESDRVRVKSGLEVLVDLPFANAPAAEVLVLLAGDPGPAEEAFLLDRRKTARAILLPPGSPLAERLKGAGVGALILVGGSDAIPAVLEAIGVGRGTGSEASAPRPTPVAVPSSRTAPTAPVATPTRASTGRVFDRYFSSRPPTPTPTPR